MCVVCGTLGCARFWGVYGLVAVVACSSMLGGVVSGGTRSFLFPLSGVAGCIIMKFGLLPDEEPAAGDLTELMREVVEWDTTPADLRVEGEKSLTGFCAKRGFSPGRVMKAMQDDRYKLARRQLSIEKGELDYKTRTILEVAYQMALKGNKDARKDWMSFYQPQKDVVEEVRVEASSPAPLAAPTIPTEMSDEELEAAVKEWANDG